MGNLLKLNSLAPPGGETTRSTLGRDQNLRLRIKPSSHEKLHVVRRGGRISSPQYWPLRETLS